MAASPPSRIAISVLGIAVLAAPAGAGGLRLEAPERVAQGDPSAGNEVRAVAVACRRDGRAAVAVLESGKSSGEAVVVRTAGPGPALRVLAAQGDLRLGGDERLLMVGAGDAFVLPCFVRGRGKDRGTLAVVSVTEEEAKLRARRDAWGVGPEGEGECLAALGDGEGDLWIAWNGGAHGRAATWFGERLGGEKPAGAASDFVAKVEDRVCPCCSPALARRPDGAMLVAYRDEADGDLRDIYLRRRPRGEVMFGEPVRVSTDGYKSKQCPMAGPALLAPDEHLVLVAYPLPGKPTRIKVARSIDGGATFSPAVEVAPGRRPTLLGVGEGVTALVFDRAEGGVAVALSRDGGASWEPPVRLDEEKKGVEASGVAAAAAPGGKSIVVAWIEREGPARAAVLRRASIE